MMQNKSLIIGLTGGTGSGKTTICSILKTLGSSIIDADIIAHQVIKNGQPAYFKIIEYFGYDVIENNEINRKVLANIVFNNKSKLKVLEEITHKYILLAINDKIVHFQQQNYPYITIDAPLLIETNLHKIVDTVWLVYAPLNIRLKRLQIRDNLSVDTLLPRINNQTPFETIKPFANFIIYNDNSQNIEHIIKNQLKMEC